MRILAIETSCDETAVAVLDASGSEKDATFTILGDALYSQAKKHAAYGGVYPALAKREHAANLVPLLDDALRESGLKEQAKMPLKVEHHAFLENLLTREPQMCKLLTEYLPTIARPDIDAIAVTQGPGLEPALWVGINFARALALVWDIPIIPVNHLEGHIVASAVQQVEAKKRAQYIMHDLPFPILGLILSGGHTEFVYTPKWGEYHVVGATRDDSIGEAFDKVARLLGIPYPGGPGLSRLAAKGRQALNSNSVEKDSVVRPLPRPMINSGDLDFSFSGLKTAVLYQVRDIGKLSNTVRARLAADFENAVTDVVEKKTMLALEEHPVHAFVLGGGVSANTCIRGRLAKMFEDNEQDVSFHVPAAGLSTDNALMIGMAGYLVHLRGTPTLQATDDLTANGSLSM